jgi:hypothetical protein
MEMKRNERGKEKKRRYGDRESYQFEVLRKDSYCSERLNVELLVKT